MLIVSGVFIIHIFMIRFTGIAGMILIIATDIHHGIIRDGRLVGVSHLIPVGIHPIIAWVGVTHLTIVGVGVIHLITVTGTDPITVDGDIITDGTVVATTEVVAGMPITTGQNMAKEGQQAQI